MHVLDHVQAVQDGAVIKVLLSVASRAPDTVPFFGKFEQIAVNSASSSLLPSSICRSKINDMIMCADGHYLPKIYLHLSERKFLLNCRKLFKVQRIGISLGSGRQADPQKQRNHQKFLWIKKQGFDYL